MALETSKGALLRGCEALRLGAKLGGLATATTGVDLVAALHPELKAAFELDKLCEELQFDSQRHGDAKDSLQALQSQFSREVAAILLAAVRKSKGQKDQAGKYVVDIVDAIVSCFGGRLPISVSPLTEDDALKEETEQEATAVPQTPLDNLDWEFAKDIIQVYVRTIPGLGSELQKTLNCWTEVDVEIPSRIVSLSLLVDACPTEMTIELAETLNKVCIKVLTTSKYPHVQQAVMDSLLPKISQWLSEDQMLSLIKATRPQTALLIGVLSVCSAKPLLGDADLWESIRQGLRPASPPAVQRQYKFVLQRLVASMDDETQVKWWADFLRIHAGVRERDLHHVQAVWRIAQRLLQSATEKQWPWIELLFELAATHENQAVAKFILTTFLTEDLGGQAHVLSQGFVVDVIVPGLALKELYKAVIIDDASGETGVLRDIETPTVELFRVWGGSSAERKQALVRKLAELEAPLSPSYAVILSKALAAMEGPCGWFGNAEVIAVREFITTVFGGLGGLGMLGRLRLAHEFLLQALVSHAIPENISLGTLLNLLEAWQLPNDTLAKLRQWVVTSKTFQDIMVNELKQYIAGESVQALTSDTRAQLALSLLADVPSCVESIAANLQDSLSCVYSSPYASEAGKINACMLVQVNAKLVQPEQILDDLMAWCLQLIQHPEEDLSSRALFAALGAMKALACTVEPEYLAPKVVKLRETTTEWLQSDDSFHFSRAILLLEVLVEICESEAKWSRDQLQLLLDKEFMLQVERKDGEASAILKRRAQAAFWVCIDKLLRVMSDTDVKLASKVTCAALDGTVKCHHSALLWCYRILGAGLTMLNGALPEGMEPPQLVQALESGLEVSDARTPSLILTFCASIFQECCFRSEEMREQVLRPLWNSLLDANAHVIATQVFGSTFWNHPELADGFYEEAIEHLTTIDKAIITSTALMEFVKPETWMRGDDTLLHVHGRFTHPLAVSRSYVLAFIEERATESWCEKYLRAAIARFQQAPMNAGQYNHAYSPQFLQKFRVMQSIPAAVRRISDPSISAELCTSLLTLLTDDDRLAYYHRCYLELAITCLMVQSPDTCLPLLSESLGDLACSRNTSVTSKLIVAALVVNEMNRQDPAWPGLHDFHRELAVKTIPWATRPRVMTRSLAHWVIRRCSSSLKDWNDAAQTLVRETEALNTLAQELLDNILADFMPLKAATFKYHCDEQQFNATGDQILMATSVRILRDFENNFFENVNKSTKPVAYRIITQDETRKHFEETGQDATDAAALNIQEKINPNAWQELLALTQVGDVALSFPRSLLRQPQTARRRAGADGLVVVCTLLEHNLPSIAALVRTCEVLGVAKIVVHSLDILKLDTFKAVTLSAGLWMPFQAVTRLELPGFLAQHKAQGSSLVGLHQADPLLPPLAEHQYAKNAVLVVADEPTGMDAAVAELLDANVSLPSLGKSPSVLPHIAGAIGIWEFVLQRRLR